MITEKPGYTWKSAFYYLSAINLLVLAIYVIFGDEKPEKSEEKTSLRPWRLSNLIKPDEQKYIVESRLESSSGPVPLIEIYTSKTVWIFTLSWFFTTMNISLFTGRALKLLEKSTGIRLSSLLMPE